MSSTAVSPPKPKEVIEFIYALLGLEVSDAPAEDDGDLTSIAEYVTEGGEPVGYIACGLATACRLGAALTQIPAGHVDDAIKQGEIPENIADNLNEIFNINVNLLHSDAGERFVLGKSTHNGEAELAAKLDECETTVVSFNVERYGVCKLVIAI